MPEVRGAREMGGIFSINDLIGAVSSQEGHSIRDTFTSSFRSCLWTGSGRAALALAMRHAKEVGFRTLVLPAYLCTSIAATAHASGLQVIYCEVDRNLGLNLEQLRHIVDPATLVYVIDYFGWPTADAIIALGEEIALLVDISHSISGKRLRYLSDQGCMVVASLRKMYPLADGGVFSSSSKLRFGTLPVRGCELQTTAMILKALYEEGAMSVKTAFLESSANFEAALEEESTKPYAMSALSRQAIELIGISFGSEQRLTNYHHLRKRLTRLSSIQHLFENVPNDVAPMCMPVRCSNRDRLKAWLIKAQIYPPIHWPLPSSVAEAKFPFAHEISQTELSLPCDFRYGTSDMDCIASAVEAYEGCAKC